MTVVIRQPSMFAVLRRVMVRMFCRMYGIADGMMMKHIEQHGYKRLSWLKNGANCNSCSGIGVRGGKARQSTLA
jgi:hypothetical protein